MAIKIDSGDAGSSPPLYYGEMKLSVIDVKSEESLAKWEKALELSRVELLQAIADFGPIPRDIRRGLAAQKDEAA